MPGYYQKQLEDNSPDSHLKKLLRVELIILIIFGVLVLLKNLIIEQISYSSFFFPGLYMGTGVLGWSYLKSNDDTYATIFKILIWIELILNIFALVFLFILTFLFASLSSRGYCNDQGQLCITKTDGREICSKNSNCEDDSIIGLATIILAVSFIIYLAVTILMCFTLSHFKKFEVERKSHHYTAV